jgi:uncharacterized membrane protein
LRTAVDKKGLLLTAGLVALYVAARLWRLTGACLWFDELFGVHAARHAWGDLWRFVAADLIHPPLFYALLKVWIALGGESVLWLRLLPVAASVAALVPFVLLARELRLSRGAVWLALLLAATNGYLVKYAQEVRMYSLLLLFGLVSLWLFARLLSRGAGRGLVFALTLTNLLLVYTHYYGWLVVACEAVYLCARARGRLLRPFTFGTCAVLVCFAPWVWACVRESGAGGGLAQNVGWIARPGAADILEMFALLVGPFRARQSSAQAAYAGGSLWLGLLLVGVPVALLLWRALRRGGEGEEGGEGAADEARRPLLFLVLFAALPALLAFAASRVLPVSVWGTRHLIASAAPFMLLAGASLVRLRPAWLKASALVVLGCWLFAAGALWAALGETRQVWCAWGELAESAFRDEARARETAANVYAFEDLVAYHLWFASGEEGARVAVVKGVEGLAEDPAYFLPRRFGGVAVTNADALSGESFWVAFRDAAWDETRPPLSTLKARGYRAEKIYEQAAGGQRAFLVRVSRAPGN